MYTNVATDHKPLIMEVRLAIKALEKKEREEYIRHKYVQGNEEWEYGYNMQWWENWYREEEGKESEEKKLKRIMLEMEKELPRKK